MADYTIIQIKIKKDKLEKIKKYSDSVGLPMTSFCRMLILEKVNLDALQEKKELNK